MKAYKDRQYLIFEFEDGKDVKYNLATGESIGKSGKVVKDIKTQLRGLGILEIIDSFQDEKYKKFLQFIDRRVNTSSKRYNRYRVDRIRNVGTFLKCINDYSEYELFFAAGIFNIEYPLRTNFKDIPKGLLKICRENNYRLTNLLISSYKDKANLFNTLLDLEFNTIRKIDVLDLLTYDRCSMGEYIYYRGYHKEEFHLLLNDYNYKAKSLLIHLDNLMTFEAIENLGSLIKEFYDYVFMMSNINNKYEKYPKNFLTTHKIACRNYNRLKVKFEEKLFEKRIDKSLEYSLDNYKIIYPDKIEDIKAEAVMQNNCVASYIQRVIDGDCHILFMRNKDNLEKSLVTLEIRNNKVVQAKGKFNRDVNTEEQSVIDKYNKKLERLGKVC